MSISSAQRSEATVASYGLRTARGRGQAGGDGRVLVPACKCRWRRCPAPCHSVLCQSALPCEDFSADSGPRYFKGAERRIDIENNANKEIRKDMAGENGWKKEDTQSVLKPERRRGAEGNESEFAQS
jgi:hypothetical protein